MKASELLIYIRDKISLGGLRSIPALTRFGMAIGNAVKDALLGFFSGPNPIWRITHPDENYGPTPEDLKQQGQSLVAQNIETSPNSQQSLAERITAALERASTAALTAAQAADKTQNTLNSAITLLTQITQKQTNADFRLAQAEGQIRSMRA